MPPPRSITMFPPGHTTHHRVCENGGLFGNVMVVAALRSGFHVRVGSSATRALIGSTTEISSNAKSTRCARSVIGLSNAIGVMLSTDFVNATNPLNVNPNSSVAAIAASCALIRNGILNTRWHAALKKNACMSGFSPRDVNSNTVIKEPAAQNGITAALAISDSGSPVCASLGPLERITPHSRIAPRIERMLLLPYRRRIASPLSSSCTAPRRLIHDQIPPRPRLDRPMLMLHPMSRSSSARDLIRAPPTESAASPPPSNAARAPMPPPPNPPAPSAPSAPAPARARCRQSPPAPPAPPAARESPAPNPPPSGDQTRTPRLTPRSRAAPARVRSPASSRSAPATPATACRTAAGSWPPHPVPHHNHGGGQTCQQRDDHSAQEQPALDHQPVTARLTARATARPIGSGTPCTIIFFWAAAVKGEHGPKKSAGQPCKRSASAREQSRMRPRIRWRPPPWAAVIVATYS